MEEYLVFEKICEKLFNELGINVSRHNQIDIGFDLILEKNNNKAIVEIKLYRTRRPHIKDIERVFIQINRIKNIIPNAQLIAIFGNKIEVSIKQLAKKEYNILILDADNLLYLFNKTSIREEYISFLNNTIVYNENYSEEKPDNDFLNFLNINDKKNNKNITTLIESVVSSNKKECSCDKLSSIKAGKNNFSLYEDTCIKILKCLFDKDLVKWEKQQVTDDKLNRYDLVCRVKKKDNEFWNLIVDEFNSRYIVFEFKNYSQSISQTQIFTTEKYLYPKALRNVAFIISRKGADKNALKITKGILRESGKLIINLTDKDLCEMVKIKNSAGEPSDYLFNKIDDFLLKLEK
ncbi:hypothetical protein [Aliarcobacter butzleri]|uniref:hypothetical protein n=1 Tax=Aliarcobacter butzleri TaxID=28197 RepID=UPI003AF776C5